MTVGTCILLLLLTVGCLVYAAPIHTALAEGVFLCLQVILPSLYAMMILAQLLIRTNAHMLLLKPLHRFTQNVLRIPDVGLAIFLLSQIGGYPIGAKLLDNELQNGTLRPKQAAILSGICFGSGPAFLFGTLSAQAGTSGCWLLFGSILLANFSLFIIACQFLKLPNLPTVSLQRLQAKTLVETVTQSGAALLQMCAMILFFRCLMTVAQASGLYDLLTIPLQWRFPKNTAEGLLSASLEITALTQLVPNTPILLALFAALLAFGGICVHLQIFTITGGRLSLCWMLSLRALAGGLAAGFCWIGCQVFQDAVVPPEICSVSAPAVQYSRTTPIASLFLVGATLLLLQAAAKQRELCRKR